MNVNTETDEESKDEPAELNEEILYNKGCIQNMAQMLQSFGDQDVSGLTQAAMNEAKETLHLIHSIYVCICFCCSYWLFIFFSVG